MKFILIVIYLCNCGRYTQDKTPIPIALGEFNTIVACQEAGKGVRPSLYGGSSAMCVPKGEAPVIEPPHAPLQKKK